MTKEELNQLRPLQREVLQLRRQLESLPLTKDSVRGSCDEWPFIERSITIIGIDKAQAGRLRKRYERKMKEIGEKIEEIERFIDTIDDSVVRQVVRYRFMNRMTWPEITANVGYPYTEAALKKMLYRYLEKTEDCPACPRKK